MALHSVGAEPLSESVMIYHKLICVVFTKIGKMEWTGENENSFCTIIQMSVSYSQCLIIKIRLTFLWSDQIISWNAANFVIAMNLHMTRLLFVVGQVILSWLRHYMDTPSPLLALYEGNPLVDHQISWSLAAARFSVKMAVLLHNLTAVLPKRLSNFRATEQLQLLYLAAFGISRPVWETCYRSVHLRRVQWV